MLGIWSLSVLRVLHKTLLVPVLMYNSETVMEGKGRDLEFGLYRWTTLEVW